MMSSLAILAASLATVASASAHEITLTSVIRDFHVYHPDFQGPIANDRNYVSDTLGADGKPVYIGGAGTATTTGAANYNQWYNDTAGVNKSIPFDLLLSNGLPNPGGVYTFEDTTFFPIDGQLFGNETYLHNYHFTLELHTEFVYQPGLSFNVLADDDLLIFIDGQKVLDLGGIHAPQNGSFNADSLGLSAGQSYDFDLFFAERHSILSTLKFSTNIQFVPEPATIVLATIGALAALQRRRITL